MVEQNSVIDEADQFLKSIKDCLYLYPKSLVLMVSKEKNKMFFEEYLINQAMARKILFDLTRGDFYEKRKSFDEKNKGHDLYIFTPIVTLTNLEGVRKRMHLYIKIDYIELSKRVYTVSFHETEYEIRR